MIETMTNKDAANKAWYQQIKATGKPWQKKRLGELLRLYPMSQCRAMMMAEAVGEKALLRATKNKEA